MLHDLDEADIVWVQFHLIFQGPLKTFESASIATHIRNELRVEEIAVGLENEVTVVCRGARLTGERSTRGC